MQNLKKVGLCTIILVFAMSLFAYFFIPYLAYSASQDIKNKNFEHAAKTNTLLGTITTNPLKKGGYYLTAGDCYLEIKDVNNAIKAYAEAEKHIQILGEFEKNRLTDLYIINKEYSKAANRDGGYKANIIQEKWDEALAELNQEIENPRLGQLIDNKVHAPYDKYLARALVYKNLGKKDLAVKDFETAISLEPLKKAEIESIYNNKDYFKDYYKRLEEIFQ